MASPHVAGVAARFLQSNPGASPATVRNEIVNQATLNHLSGIPAGTVEPAAVLVKFKVTIDYREPPAAPLHGSGRRVISPTK